MTAALIAFWIFLALGFLILGKVWFDAYAISPLDPQQVPARLQLMHYWKTYRKHYPHSYLTEACILCVILALVTAILAPFFIAS